MLSVGFDMDPEAQHVTDISQKLASFTIDTDTNSSIHTGSDPGDSTETESMIDRLVISVNVYNLHMCTLSNLVKQLQIKVAT